MRQVPNANHRLDEHILRALNKIKKPATAEEITELLNRDLGPGDQPFQVREVATWLRNAEENVLSFVLAGKSPAQVTLLAILDVLVLTSRSTNRGGCLHASSLEKIRLSTSSFGFPKVAQPYADEPIALLWTEGHSFSQLQRDVCQLFAGRGRSVWRMATSENLELACLHFEDHGTGYA